MRPTRTHLATACAAGIATAAVIATPNPASAEISDGVVRIGVLTDMSGPFSDNVGAGSVLAAQMAVEDFGGTVAGAPIEIVSADHQNRADVGSTLARRWFDAEGVDMITEMVSSAVALSVQELARERNRMAIHTGPGTPQLTGEACSPVGFHWAYDNYAYANVVASAIVDRGLDEWFFLTVDYSFGHTLEESATHFVEQAGGRILGRVRHPLGASDFSSFLLQAQASGASVIGLASAGTDMTNSLMQANEFGLIEAGQAVASLLVNLPDIHALGLQDAQGLMLADSFYWNMTDETRAWSERFMERFDGRAPGSLQAAVYGAVMHYLKAVEATGTDDAAVVAEAMRQMPIEDFYTDGGVIREDGRVLRDMYLFQVKSPDQSSGPWDYYEHLATIPGEQAFRPLADGGCPLVDGG